MDAEELTGTGWGGLWCEALLTPTKFSKRMSKVVVAMNATPASRTATYTDFSPARARMKAESATIMPSVPLRQTKRIRTCTTHSVNVTTVSFASKTMGR